MSSRTTTIGLVLLLSAAFAQADDLRIGTLKYAKITVIGVEDSELIYRTQAGIESRRVVNEITQITLVDRVDFNAGEKALADGDPNAALKSYGRALALADTDWLKQLVRYRQLLAFQKDKQIDRAIELWRRLCKPENGSENAMAMMPGEDAFGEAGSTANQQAIKGLLQDRPDRDTSDYDRAITKLLLDLYTFEGDDEAASTEAARLAGQPAPGTEVEDDGSEDGPRSETNLSERLAAATVLMNGRSESGWAQAIETIEADLHQYSDDMLAEALFILAHATRKQAGVTEGDEGRVLLLEAGVHYMYVVTFFPASDEAGEALLEAGAINEEIGNIRAARQAYAAVRTRYGHLPVVDKASAALEALDNNTTD
jgi:tetratricopeptide (TPR) repeat protein